MHFLTCVHQFVLLIFYIIIKKNMNSNKTNVERNAKRKPTKYQPCLEHSAKTYHKVIINVSNCSVHGRRNRMAQGARAPIFSQICMKSSLFSVNIALLHVKLPHNACALTFLMLPMSLAPLVFLITLGGGPFILNVQRSMH